MARSILVTGDVVLDLNLYSGRRRTPVSPEKCGMRSIHSPGGAMLTFQLLDALRHCSLPPKTAKPDVLVPDLTFGLKETTEKALRRWPSQFEAGAVWEQYEGPKKGEAAWRLSKNLGYGPVQSGDYPANPGSETSSGFSEVGSVFARSSGMQRVLSLCMAEQVYPEVSAPALDGTAAAA